MKEYLKYLVFLFVAGVVFSSCKKDKVYPKAPEISFKEFQQFTNSAGIDDSVKLVISFTDGDGDIGLADGDTLEPYNIGSVYYYNFYIKYFKKQNGNYQELVSSIPRDARIPYIDNTNKSLAGDIVNKLDILGNNFNNDTLRFECYIYDRGLNKSNVVTTGEIVLKTQ